MPNFLSTAVGRRAYSTSIGSRIAIQSAAPLSQGGGWGARALVGWGDSLTGGTGASAGQDYLTQLSGLLGGRGVSNQGIGGQTSTQIGARQGGVPLTVTLAGDIPAIAETLLYDWDFTGGNTNGFAKWNALGVVAFEADGVRITGASVANQGIRITSGVSFPVSYYRSEMDYTYTLGGSLGNRVSARPLDGSNISLGDVGLSGDQPFIPTAQTSGVGSRFSFVFPSSVGSDTEIVIAGFRLWSRDADSYETVSAKSVNVLQEAGVYTGTLTGSLEDGNELRISTDASGNWTAVRLTAGASAISSAEPLLLVPEQATEHRSDTALLWPGRNNFLDPTTVKSDIAGMVSYLGHSRYLVGSVLPDSTDSPPNLATLTTLNSDLSTLYANRFVDHLTPLQAANDGSADDLADVAAGIVPRSLRSDSVHLNDAGYAVVAATWRGALATFGG